MKTAPLCLRGAGPVWSGHWVVPPPSRLALLWRSSAALTEDSVPAARSSDVSHAHAFALSPLHGIPHCKIWGARGRPVLISSPNLHTSSPNASFLSTSRWKCLFPSICDSELPRSDLHRNEYAQTLRQS